MIYQKEIDDLYDFDLVVCGGGMSGIAAAISAARNGVSTLLIEKTGCLGGTATNGGVNHLLGAKRYIGASNSLKKCISGLFDEICDKMISSGAAIDPATVDFSHNPHGWIPVLGEGLIFDAEQLKFLLEKMCTDAGVKLLYYTDIIDAVTSEQKIERLVVHNKSGLFAVKGRYFVDATGDADIAFLSGNSVKVGREEDGLVAPATMEMHIEGVDTERLSKYIKENNARRFREEIARWREEGIWDFPFDSIISVQLVRDDVYMMNTIRQVGVDGLDGESLTEGTLDGRRQNFRLFEIIKSRIPGFENASIREIASVIGVRETRRINGEYVMTVNDLITNTNFDDTIALSAYGWDLPDPKSPSLQPMHNISKPEFTPIPFRCLIPDKSDNLLVVGRCISVERDVLGPVRVMGPCVAMGQAAGIAAAVALKSEISFSKIEVSQLQAEIKSAGGIISTEDVKEQNLN